MTQHTNHRNPTAADRPPTLEVWLPEHYTKIDLESDVDFEIAELLIAKARRYVDKIADSKFEEARAHEYEL